MVDGIVWKATVDGLSSLVCSRREYMYLRMGAEIWFLEMVRSFEQETETIV